jgi:hypothetical protein
VLDQHFGLWPNGHFSLAQRHFGLAGPSRQHDALVWSPRPVHVRGGAVARLPVMLWRTVGN